MHILPTPQQDKHSTCTQGYYNENSLRLSPGVPERGPLAFMTREARGAVLPLAFHWDSNEVKRLLCLAKVSHFSKFRFRFHFLELFQLSRLDSNF